MLSANTDIITKAAELNDGHLDALLERQVLDPDSRWMGGFPSRELLHEPGPAAGFIKRATAAYLQPASRYYRDETLMARMELARQFLERGQTPDGNVSLLITNFNSPPDTGFVVRNLATAARLAMDHGEDRILAMIQPFLLRAGNGMAKGGIHTPNHRWVVCAALAQLHDLFPNQKYVDRIDAWLAEGIDIDRHGQYQERSTAIYNPITNDAFSVIAKKLDRPELLEPVRKNLNAMTYLLHHSGEVVTEISRRQDLNARGTLSRYWFSLRLLAITDGNGQYATMLEPLEPEQLDLALLMEYPQLADPLPAAEPLPDDFVKTFPEYGLTQIRRGRTSIGIFHTGRSTWMTLRHGEAVIPAVRFASAFFGKAQFIPEHFEARDDGFFFSQELDGPYFQPLNFVIDPEEWRTIRPTREHTEVCHLRYEGVIRETANGVKVIIKAHGTEPVPLAVEIAFRDGGEMRGADPVPWVDEAYLLREGFGEYQFGKDLIRFGPGIAETAYTQVRGAEPKPAHPCVYLTSYTPFEHTIRFEFSSRE